VVGGGGGGGGGDAEGEKQTVPHEGCKGERKGKTISRGGTKGGMQVKGK